MGIFFNSFKYQLVSELCYLVFNFVQFDGNRAGFWSAMASNVTFQSRNVLSKKVMVKKEVTEISRFAS